MGTNLDLVLIVVCALLLFPLEATKSDSTLEPVDLLISRLLNQNWSESDADCFRDTNTLFHGVKNRTLLATWTWNSMQLPVGNLYGSKYHLGNFDQCLQVPWYFNKGLPMQYCLADVQLSRVKKYDGEIDPFGAADEYIGMKSIYGSRFNNLFFGVCLPTTCKPASIAKISKLLFQLSHLPLESIAVDPKDCQVAAEKLELSIEFYGFWCFIYMMALACIFVYFVGNFQDKSTASETMRCFCLRRNFDSLSEISKSEIKMMHGMRTLTSGTVIVVHYIYIIMEHSINYLDIEKDFTQRFIGLTLHIDIIVDTFFVMSGLLHFKGLLSSRSNPLHVLCKRYLRMLAPLALALICLGHVLPHLGSGPVWPRLIREYLQPCADNWWKNLLMMGNIFDGKVCMVVIWYLHCDFHLTVLSTAIFVLFQRSRKRSKINGYVIFFAAYFLSITITTFIRYWFEVPGLVFYDFGESLDMTQNKMYERVYVKSHSRAGPYIIGMVLGYFMTLYKPQEYRKVISKTWSIIGCMFSLFVMTLILFMGINLFKKSYSAIMTVMLASLDRSVWALAICAMIVVCEYGTLPIVNDFLSSKVFVPLSKLSYSNYVWQIVFMYRNVMSLRAPFSYDFYHVIINGLGYVVICYCFSYLFWLFVEAPVSNLVTLLFDNRLSKESQNAEKTKLHNENGVKSRKLM